MKRIRKYGAVVLGIAAAASVAVGASGCGAANTIDPVAKAASISTTTPGFQMRFVVRFGSPQLPTALAATGTGSINARSRTGSVLFVMNAGNDPDLTKAFGGSMAWSSTLTITMFSICISLSLRTVL